MIVFQFLSNRWIIFYLKLSTLKRCLCYISYKDKDKKNSQKWICWTIRKAHFWESILKPSLFILFFFEFFDNNFNFGSSGFSIIILILGPSGIFFKIISFNNQLNTKQNIILKKTLMFVFIILCLIRHNQGQAGNLFPGDPVNACSFFRNE